MVPKPTPADRIEPAFAQGADRRAWFAVIIAVLLLVGFGVLTWLALRTPDEWTVTPRIVLVIDFAATLLVAVFLGLLLRDTRLRQRTERDLRASQSRFRSLADSLDDIVFGLDVNGRVTELYGRLGMPVDRAAIIGRGSAEIFGTDVPEHEEARRRALEGVTHLYEWSMQQPDGRLRYFQISMAPRRDGNGRINGVVGVARDISRLKETERRLERALQTADRANHAKNEFLSRVSHELRTPLHAILGYGQLLAQEELTEDGKDSSQQILRGGRHLLALINEILDISRIEAGTLAFTEENVRVATVCNDVIGLMRPVARARAVSIVADVDPELHVTADAQRVRQILMNLVSNAVKYNLVGGRVDVTAAHEDGFVRLRIADTGPGIPADERAQLFEPFERLRTSEGVEGTGLGLVLARALAEAMGGQLAFETEVGRGSTFWVDLPVADAGASVDVGIVDAIQEQLDLPGNGDRTVLYIEDNEANLMLIRRILAREGGYHFIGARDGADGLRLAREAEPDLVLLDLHLPEIDGEEVLRRLRRDPNTQDLPVIVLSADATSSRIRRLLDNGAHAYITKPLDIGRFVETVRHVLEGVN